MAQNIKRSICLTPGMLEELQIFASSKNITVAEAIRYLLERGLSLTMFTTRVSSAALQCNVAVLAENYIDQATPEEILANALRQSCRITRTKPKSDAEYLAEAHEWLNADLDTPSDK